MEDYSEYIIQGEPDKRERVRNWMTAIGLQDVDDLKPSQYFLDTVKQNIEGKITLEEVRKLVDQYYTTKEGLQQEKRTEEADKAQDAAHKIFAAGGMSADMPTTELSESDLTDGKIAVLDLLVISKMAPSKGEARRLIQQGGVLVNDAKVEAIDATVDADALTGDGIIVRKGKKTYRRFCIQ